MVDGGIRQGHRNVVWLSKKLFRWSFVVSIGQISVSLDMNIVSRYPVITR